MKKNIIASIIVLTLSLCGCSSRPKHEDYYRLQYHVGNFHPEKYVPYKRATQAQKSEYEDYIREHIDENFALPEISPIEEFGDMDYYLYASTNVDGPSTQASFYQNGVINNSTKDFEEAVKINMELSKKLLRTDDVQYDYGKYAKKFMKTTTYYKQKAESELVSPGKDFYLYEQLVYLSGDCKSYSTIKYDPVKAQNNYPDFYYSREEFKGKDGIDLLYPQYSLFSDYKKFIDSIHGEYGSQQIIYDLENDSFELINQDNIWRYDYDEYDIDLLYSETDDIVAVMALEETDVDYNYRNGFIDIYSLPDGKPLYNFSLNDISDIDLNTYRIYNISQFRGDDNNGFIIFNIGFNAYKFTYPDGEIEHLGSMMKDVKFSPDGKYMVYGTFPDYYWPDEMFDPVIYNLQNGWYIVELETGKTAFFPVEYFWDEEFTVWLEKDAFEELMNS